MHLVCLEGWVFVLSDGGEHHAQHHVLVSEVGRPQASAKAQSDAIRTLRQAEAEQKKAELAVTAKTQALNPKHFTLKPEP